MGHKRYWTAVTAAGMIGAMALGSAFTSYAAGSWTKSNDNWTYVDNGQVYTDGCRPVKDGTTWTRPLDI